MAKFVKLLKNDDGEIHFKSPSDGAKLKLTYDEANDRFLCSVVEPDTPPDDPAPDDPEVVPPSPPEPEKRSLFDRLMDYIEIE